MKLYGVPGTRTTRVTWALEEIGAEYEFVTLSFRDGSTRSESYLALNPDGKVPTFVDGDLVLSESAAILFHLGDKFPDSGILPAPGTPLRAMAYKWAFFSMTELEQALWTLSKHRFALPEAQRVPEVKPTALWEFARAAKVFAKGLGDQEFILGEQFSVADILLCHTLLWATKAKAPIEHDNLQAYFERISARPALAKARQKEAAAEA